METDQESSLVQAVCRYVQTTNDITILDENVQGIPVRTRLKMALKYPLTHRFSKQHGLIWGATTADWGDVQPEHPWGVEFDENSHRAIDIYDNALLMVAIGEYIETIAAADPTRREKWSNRRQGLHKSVRAILWDQANAKFIPHIYLQDSPFPKSFDEKSIFFHGGTAVAIEAELLSREEIETSLQKMRQNIAAANEAIHELRAWAKHQLEMLQNELHSRPYKLQSSS